MMDAEIDKKLDDVGVRLHLRPSQIARFKKEVGEIVVGTIPEARDSSLNVKDNEEYCANLGFNVCHTEMLSRWTRKEPKNDDR